MQKKFALALAAMAAAPAWAQGTGVVLYGRINTGFDRYEASGATGGAAFDFKARNRVWDQGSRLGVRGTENLGAGLAAIFMVESGINADTGTNLGQSGSPNTATGFLASREAWVGLAGSWGHVRFGKQNVWWGSGSMDQTGANFLELQNVFVLGAGGILNAPTSRQPNVVSYTTPMLAGFMGSVYYSPSSETAGPGVDPKDKIWDVTLRYFRGPLTAQYDWVRRYDVGQVGGRDSYAHKLGAAYRYAPGSQVSLIWTRLGVDNAAAGSISNAAATSVAAWNAGDNLKSQSLNLEWEHTFGNIQGFAGLGVLQDVKGASSAAGTPETGAKLYYLGARYNFSKRTGIYVNYIKLNNEANQFVDLAAAGMSSAIAGGTNAAGAAYVQPVGAPLTGGGTLGPASAGADPQALGIGLQHNF